MHLKNNFPSKIGLGALAIGALMAFNGEKADAATLVTDGGGTYDITSDNLFFGTVENPAGGSGSYRVDFTSSTDPLPATASASLTDDVLEDTFTNLTMQWRDTDSGTSLATADVEAPVTELDTVFGEPGVDQSLVFNWEDSVEGSGFDFDVTPVPLPAGAWMLLSALGGMGVLQYRRRKTA